MDSYRAGAAGARPERRGRLNVGATLGSVAERTVQAADAPSYVEITGSEIVFILIGVGTPGAALLCVTGRNIVRAALWLVVSLGGLAGLYWS